MENKVDHDTIYLHRNSENEATIMPMEVESDVQLSGNEVIFNSEDDVVIFLEDNSVNHLNVSQSNREQQIEEQNLKIEDDVVIFPEDNSVNQLNVSQSNCEQQIEERNSKNENDVPIRYRDRMACISSIESLTEMCSSPLNKAEEHIHSTILSTVENIESEVACANQTEHQLYCDVCKEYFTNYISLHDHCGKIHCENHEDRNKTEERNQPLLQHTVENIECQEACVSESEKSFSCDICNQYYKNYHSLCDHIRKVHGEDFEYFSKTEEKIQSLTQCAVDAVECEETVMNESEQKFQCDSCNQSYNNYISLCDHYRLGHSEIFKELENGSFEEMETVGNKTDSDISDSMSKLSQKDTLACSAVDSNEKSRSDARLEFHAFTERPVTKEQHQIEMFLRQRTCTVCYKMFSYRTDKSRHEKEVHKKYLRKQIHMSYSKCIECNLKFEEKDSLRTHLTEYHGLDMKPILLGFSNMEEFYAWKSNIERDTLTTYQQKARSEKSRRYVCHRSGRSYPRKGYEDKVYHRMRKFKNGLRLGINCTSEIFLDFSKKGGILVKFYPAHYGHGNEMAIAELSKEEQSAINELTCQGIPLEKLIEELKGNEVYDKTLVFPIKERYRKWIKNAYRAEDYATDVSDAENVSKWIQKCCLIEESPILFCCQENIGCEDEKFILIIMTEFQKHILMSSSKEIICFDVRKRFQNDELVVLMIIDELKSAFPAAYCLTNSLTKDVMMQFITCIKDSVGNIIPKYLMSNNRPLIYKSWVEVMGCGPQWLWSRWHVRCSLILNLRRSLRGKALKRCELYNTMMTIFDCKSEIIFKSMYSTFVEKIKSDKEVEKFRKWMIRELDNNTEKWANCYRTDIACLEEVHLEAMHQAIVLACSLGARRRKHKFLNVLMTILRFRIIDRILNSFDEMKINLAVNAINLSHVKGLAISEDKIVPVSTKIWMIQDEDDEEEFVSLELEKCLDHCPLKCETCIVCVHQFSCSCMHNMIDANLCKHIHAVAFRVKDRSSPFSSHTDRSSTSMSINNFSLPRNIDSSSTMDDTTLPQDIMCSTAPQSPDSLQNLPVSKTSNQLNVDSESAESNVLQKEQLLHSSEKKTNNLKTKGGIRQTILNKILVLYGNVKTNDLDPFTLKSIYRKIHHCNEVASGRKTEYNSRRKMSVKSVYLVKSKKAAVEAKKRGPPLGFKQMREALSSGNSEREKKQKIDENNISSSNFNDVSKISEILEKRGLTVKKIDHPPHVVGLSKFKLIQANKAIKE